jgi:RNA polymerase sigma-70 factor, ECF subfamily
MDDRELLERLSRGDEAAYDTIFRTWYARLVRLAESVVRDRAVAEELVQDVMLELWRRREQLAADGSPQAYLFRATRNRALNHMRHVKIEQRDAIYVAGEGSREAPAPARLEAEEIESAVQRAMDELPPRCREVFEMSRVQGLKYAEIATALGVSVKAVEAHMGKALKTMRVHLAQWLPRGDRL